MSKRELGLYIIDIFIAIDKIARYTIEVNDANTLLHDEMRWDASIRELEIIGEATKSLLSNNVLDDRYRRIVDFRNQINHGYFGIDEEIVWEVITKKLPEFENDLLQIVEESAIDLCESIQYAKDENSKNTKVLLFLEKLETKFPI